KNPRKRNCVARPRKGKAQKARKETRISTEEEKMNGAMSCERLLIPPREFGHACCPGLNSSELLATGSKRFALQSPVGTNFRMNCSNRVRHLAPANPCSSESKEYNRFL